jgi:hypothetical protein
MIRSGDLVVDVMEVECAVRASVTIPRDLRLFLGDNGDHSDLCRLCKHPTPRQPNVISFCS